MTTYLTSGAAMFVFVALKAFQQRNVAFDHYAPVIPISWAMALTEVYVIATIAVQGFNWWLAFAIGTGSGFGAVCAMWLHKRLLGGKRYAVLDKQRQRKRDEAVGEAGVLLHPGRDAGGDSQRSLACAGECEGRGQVPAAGSISGTKQRTL
jgi:hypothetical protein